MTTHFPTHVGGADFKNSGSGGKNLKFIWIFNLFLFKICKMENCAKIFIWSQKARIAILKFFFFFFLVFNEFCKNFQFFFVLNELIAIIGFNPIWKRIKALIKITLHILKDNQDKYFHIHTKCPWHFHTKGVRTSTEYFKCNDWTK